MNRFTTAIEIAEARAPAYGQIAQALADVVGEIEAETGTGPAAVRVDPAVRLLTITLVSRLRYPPEIMADEQERALVLRLCRSEVPS